MIAGTTSWYTVATGQPNSGATYSWPIDFEETRPTDRAVPGNPLMTLAVTCGRGRDAPVAENVSRDNDRRAGRWVDDAAPAIFSVADTLDATRGVDDAVPAICPAVDPMARANGRGTERAAGRRPSKPGA